MHLCRSYCDNQCANKAHVRCTVLLLDNHSTVWCVPSSPRPSSRKARLANIRANQQRLAELGLANAAPLGPKQDKPTPASAKTKREVKVPLPPERRSKRARGEKPDYTGEKVCSCRNPFFAPMHAYTHCCVADLSLFRQSQFSRSSRPPTQR